MRMLAMNSLMDDAERRRQERVVHSPMNSSDTDKEDDDVDELDPVDGFPSPPMRVRPRRRFVKPGLTTYELSFSRRPAAARRRGAAALKDQSDGHKPPQDCDEYRPALPGARSAPAVSSLSSVLTEVMSGKTKALNNVVDTTPPQPNVTYVVEHAADGTPYVAASDGNKYFENSTIGQIFLKSAPNHAGPKGRRSDLDFLQSGGWQATRRSDFVGDAAEGAKNGEQVADIDAQKGSKSLLGFKGFHMGKKKDKKGSATDLKAVQEQDDHTAVLGAHEAVAHQNMDNEFPMLDSETVDRNRADSSWEVPAAKNNVLEVAVQQPTA
ncbi:Glycerol-3-phosphate dehydrogenase, partial [Phytophthora palmivora]